MGRLEDQLDHRASDVAALVRAEPARPGAAEDAAGLDHAGGVERRGGQVEPPADAGRVAERVEQEPAFQGVALELSQLEPRVQPLHRLEDLPRSEQQQDDQGDRPEGDRGRRAGRGVPPRPLARPFRQAGLRAVLHRQVFEEPPQVLRQLPRAAMPTARVGVEALGDEGVEAGGDLGAAGADRRRAGAPFGEHPAERRERAAPGRRVLERRLAREHLEQDQAQRIEVGPLVDRAGRRGPLRVEGVEVFGRHVGEGAAQHRPGDRFIVLARAAGRRVHGEVEVQEHRRPVARDQDVRRLQVAVQQAPGMGVVEPLGQPGDDPRRGAHGVGAAQEAAGREPLVPGLLTPLGLVPPLAKQPERGEPARGAIQPRWRGGGGAGGGRGRVDADRGPLARRIGPPRRAGRLDGLRRQPAREHVEGVDQAPAARIRPASGPRLLQHLGQVRAAEVGHAEQPKAGRGVVPDGMHGDDVRVLEPGQGLGLVPLGRRDLQGHEPPPQAGLAGEEDAGERPAAQLGDQPESAHLRPHPGEFRVGGPAPPPGRGPGRGHGPGRGRGDGLLEIQRRLPGGRFRGRPGRQGAVRGGLVRVERPLGLQVPVGERRVVRSVHGHPQPPPSPLARLAPRQARPSNSVGPRRGAVQGVASGQRPGPVRRHGART